MIDHFNLPVSDLAKSRAFYERILSPLGYRFLMRDGAAVGFGTSSWAFGLIMTEAPFPVLHVAFTAPSRSAVDRFHEAALAAEARSNGAPAVRRQYDPNYYAAFILDPVVTMWRRCVVRPLPSSEQFELDAAGTSNQRFERSRGASSMVVEGVT